MSSLEDDADRSLANLDRRLTSLVDRLRDDNLDDAGREQAQVEVKALELLLKIRVASGPKEKDTGDLTATLNKLRPGRETPLGGPRVG